jgi:hypothetical protein
MMSSREGFSLGSPSMRGVDLRCLSGMMSMAVPMFLSELAPTEIHDMSSGLFQFAGCLPCVSRLLPPPHLTPSASGHHDLVLDWLRHEFQLRYVLVLHSARGVVHPRARCGTQGLGEHTAHESAELACEAAGAIYSI